MKLVAIAASLISLTGADVDRSGNRSLTNFELRQPSSEERAPDTPVANDDEESFSALRERQILLEAAIRSLTDSLVQSNLDAETARRQAADLALKLETFGISTIDQNQVGNEQRLLAAINALRQMKTEADDARLELMRLSEAVKTLVKTADRVDPVARLAVETELRRTKEILEDKSPDSQTSALMPSLNHAVVVDVRNDLNLVIANVGGKQGVRIGMTFKILHGQKPLGTVRVVDVRDHVCGAVIQNLNSIKNPIRQGDHLRIETKL